MKHLILSRCNFNDTDLFLKYFDVMKTMFIPSVKEQTCKNFKLFIYVNKNKPEHGKMIEEEFKGSDVNFVLDMPSFKTRVVQEKYTIQTRHDCDDYMSPNYVQKIQEIYSENIETYPEFLIHAQPIKVDYSTKDEYMGPRYKDTATSMFLSLCQRNPTMNILQEKHGQFPNLVPKVFCIDTGYVKLVCHGNNILSKIKKTDIKITKNEQS